MESSAIAPLALTVVLAGLTGWYAWETRRMVKNMELDREEQLRPILVFEAIPWQANLIKLRIQNVGNGAALDIAGTIKTTTKTGEEIVIPWSYSALCSQKYEEFGVPMPKGAEHTDKFKFEKIYEKVTEVHADLVYQSIYHANYELCQSIGLSSLLNDWGASGMLATEDHPERIMPRIAKALENIAKK